MLFVAAFVFSYYTMWAFVTVSACSPASSSRFSPAQICSLHTRTCSFRPTTMITLHHPQPFLSSSSSIHSLFPPREWAVRLPALILVVGLGGVGAFVGRVMMAEEKKRAEKAQKAKQG